jgi:tetratricopeptide (TPR) repeat protein
MTLSEVRIVIGLLLVGAYLLYMLRRTRLPSSPVDADVERALNPGAYEKRMAEEKARKRQELDGLIERNPNNVEHLIQRIQAHESDNESEAALRDIATAMRLDPSRSWSLLFMRHRQLDRLGRQQEALADLLEANRLAPRGYANHRSTADFYRRMGNPDAGVAVLDEALSKEPENLHLLVERATYLSTIQRHDEALRDIAESIEREPRESERRMRSIYQIKILTEARRLDEALAAADRYVGRYPDDSSGYGSRAKVYAAMGRAREAQSDRDKSFSLGRGSI